MNSFLKTAGWCFTVFYFYQASLYLPEYFVPSSVMPCVTRMLDSYILWFVFPMSLIMAGIVAVDIRTLHRGLYARLSKKFIAARVAFGGAAAIAVFGAALRILAAV